MGNYDGLYPSDLHGRLTRDPGGTDRRDGTPQKLLDVTSMSNLGWSPSIDLRIGLIQTYNWYLKHKAASIQKEDL